MTQDGNWVTHREADIRFREHDRQHDLERASGAEALRLAREALEKALARTNEFREEATQDKAKYAELTTLNAEIAKLEATLKSEMAAIRSSQAGTYGDIRSLQNQGSYTKGRDLGMLGLAASLGGAMAGAVVALLT